MRTAAISLLTIFISVFLYSEVGFAFSEKVASESNDYCLIVKGADLSLNKTIDSNLFKLKIDKTISVKHFPELTLQNSYAVLQIESNNSHDKTSKVYLYDCTFLI